MLTDENVLPQWHREFILGLESSHSKLELRVLDWNRVLSNKSGSVVVDLSKLRIGTFYDEWRPLDTQGELHIMIHISPLTILSPHSLNLKLQKYRIHLESSEYYPGQTLRGYFVMSSSKSFKFSHIKLIVEGASRTDLPLYYAVSLFLARAGTLAGDPDDRTVVHSLGDGFFIFPFEFVLPLNLTHSYGSSHLTPRAANFNLYRVIVDVEIVPGHHFNVIVPLRILAHPMHAVLE